MIPFIQQISRFLVLVIVQIFVLNNIQFLGFVNPYLYILFLLLLPVKFPRWLSLLLGFALGLIIDSFLNTPGVHTSASVLVAFIRLPILRLFTTIEEGANPTPSIKQFGVLGFTQYVTWLVLLHHATVYMIENFSVTGIAIILLKVLVNTVVTTLIILGLQFLRKK